MAKEFAVERLEERVPMTVAVNISSVQPLPGMETVFTENVSMHGARVVSARRWRPGDHLSFALLPGDFRVNARVVYCRAQRDREFALGLEFLEPAGSWFLTTAAGSGDNLHG
jgi:hypothetical protein